MKVAPSSLSPAARAFTLGEVMISLTILSVVMATVLTGTTAITGSMMAAENYSVGQLATVDYMTLDLRRAASYTFTTAGEKLTLPLDLNLPQYYAADGRTPSAPTRTKVTVENKHDKKHHKIIESTYYYHYGTLGSTTLVRYYLTNGTLYRKEGTRAAQAIGSGINEVTFSSPDVAANATAAQKLAAILDNPVVTSRVDFLPTRRSRVAPPPLTGTTFLREYYYSSYQ